jgi:hypothetical protein
MVGYDEDAGRRDDAIVRLNGDSIWVGDYAGAVASLYELGLILDYDITWAPGDQCSFWEARYDAIGLFEGGRGSEANVVYPYYHTDADTVDKLSIPLATRAGKVAAGVVGHLARSRYIGIDDPSIAAGSGTTPRTPFSVFPNPYRCGSAGGVTFRGVAAPATIAVYDIAGRKVARAEVAPGSGDYVWRPDGRGRTLAPGVYVYRVEGKDQREAGKLVVAGP